MTRIKITIKDRRNASRFAVKYGVCLPAHVVGSVSRNPLLQIQRYERSVLTQRPFSQACSR